MRSRPGAVVSEQRGLDRYLATSQLLDCHGHVTHTFTLLPDGLVRVTSGSVTVVVDPHRRTVHPPGAHLPQEVIDHACSLAREGLG